MASSGRPMQSAASRRRARPRTPRFAARRLLLAAGIAATALAAPAAARPRLGLALGGGAARGIAHVGVLEWLEEHRVPVDCVAGTSMGGLVGGIYATGMSASELHALLSGIDWDHLFQPTVDYEALTYRRKEDAWQYPVRFELGLQDGVSLPAALNPGQYIGLLLSRLVLDHSGHASFDDLPVPFRCTGVDLATGQPIVFGSGSLPEALRATMAIPGAFDPVRSAGRVLVDGGVLNNVPVNAVRDLGADVVVAVEVMAIEKGETPEHLLALAERSLRVMMGALAQPGLANADRVLEPELHGLSTEDFAAVDALAARGHAAAAADSAYLIQFAVSPVEWEAHLAAKRARGAAGPIVPQFIELHGLEGRAARAAAAHFESLVGRPLDPAAIDQLLIEVLGDGRAVGALYRVVHRGDRTGLAVDLQPRLHAPPWMIFAVNGGSRGVDVNFALASRVTFLDPTTSGSEWRTDVAVGTTLGASSELLQPLGGSRYWVAPRAEAYRAVTNAFANGEPVARYGRWRTAAGGDLGLFLGRTTELRAGYEIGWFDTQRYIGDPGLTEPGGWDQQLRLRFAYDGGDRPHILHRGNRTEAGAAWYLTAPDAERDFAQVRFRELVAIPIGARGTLQLDGEAGATLGGEPPLGYGYALGGTSRLRGIDPGAFAGRHLALGRLEYQLEIARVGSVSGDRLLLTAAGEIGSAFETWESAEAEYSGTAGVLVETPLGPAFAGLTASTRARTSFQVLFGRPLR